MFSGLTPEFSRDYRTALDLTPNPHDIRAVGVGCNDLLGRLAAWVEAANRLRQATSPETLPARLSLPTAPRWPQTMPSSAASDARLCHRPHAATLKAQAQQLRIEQQHQPRKEASP